MLAGVIGPLHEAQIAKAVVGLVFVLVVDNVSGWNKSVCLLPDMAVFEDVSVFTFVVVPILEAHIAAFVDESEWVVDSSLSRLPVAAFATVVWSMAWLAFEA